MKKYFVIFIVVFSCILLTACFHEEKTETTDQGKNFKIVETSLEDYNKYPSQFKWSDQQCEKDRNSFNKLYYKDVDIDFEKTPDEHLNILKWDYSQDIIEPIESSYLYDDNTFILGVYKKDMNRDLVIWDSISKKVVYEYRCEKDITVHDTVSNDKYVF